MLRWSLAVAILIVTVIALTIGAIARDRGEYANSPNRDWFNHLASGKGLCCSFADGYVIEDADWETKDGHYRVRIPRVEGGTDLEWVDVPDDAVINEPNKIGRTMVWPTYGYLGMTVRCFMPSAMG